MAAEGRCLAGQAGRRFQWLCWVRSAEARHVIEVARLEVRLIHVGGLGCPGQVPLFKRVERFLHITQVGVIRGEERHVVGGLENCDQVLLRQLGKRGTRDHGGEVRIVKPL